MDRVSTWAPGDMIIDCRWQKPRKIKTITTTASFTRIRTACGKDIVGEAIDFYDLVIPNLEFGVSHESRPTV